MTRNEHFDELGVERFTTPIETTGLSIDSQNVVDLSNEGYDGSQSKPLNDVFQEYGGNTVYVFPEGTYRYQTEMDWSGVTGHVSFIGSPEATINVVDNPPIGDFPGNGKASVFYFPDELDSLVIKNIEVDITGQGSAGYDIDWGLCRAFIADYAHIENLTLTGQRHRHQEHPTNGSTTDSSADASGGAEDDASLDHATLNDGQLFKKHGDRETFKVLPSYKDSSVYVRNLTMMDGGTYHGNVVSSVERTTGYAIGVAGGGGNNSNGTLILDSCSVGGFIDNGFYVKNKTNRVVMRGCYAENNSSSNIRPSKNDHISNCEIHIDSRALDHEASTLPGDLNANQTGLFLDSADSCVVDGIKINIDLDASHEMNDIVRLQDDPSSTGDNRNATIRNLDLDIAGSGSMASIEAGIDHFVLDNWNINDQGTEGKVAPLSIRGDAGQRVTCRDLTINANTRKGVYVQDVDVLFDNCYFNAGTSPDQTDDFNGYDLLVGDITGPGSVGTVRLRNCTMLGNKPIKVNTDNTVDNFMVSGTTFVNAAEADVMDNQGTVTEWHVQNNSGWNPTFASDYYDHQVDGTDGQAIINFKTN